MTTRDKDAMLVLGNTLHGSRYAGLGKHPENTRDLYSLYIFIPSSVRSGTMIRKGLLYLLSSCKLPRLRVQQRDLSLTFLVLYRDSIMCFQNCRMPFLVKLHCRNIQVSGLRSLRHIRLISLGEAGLRKLETRRNIRLESLGILNSEVMSITRPGIRVNLVYSSYHLPHILCLYAMRSSQEIVLMNIRDPGLRERNEWRQPANCFFLKAVPADLSRNIFTARSPACLMVIPELRNLVKLRNTKKRLPYSNEHEYMRKRLGDMIPVLEGDLFFTYPIIPQGY